VGIGWADVVGATDLMHIDYGFYDLDFSLTGEDGRVAVCTLTERELTRDCNVARS
jgi:hypothetical protein